MLNNSSVEISSRPMAYNRYITLKYFTLYITWEIKHFIDVTNIDRPKYFKRTGHYFPPLFYLLSMNEDTFKMRIKNHNDYPRGGLLRAIN